MARGLIDSHVHLYELEHLHSLAWMTTKSPLYGQHSVSEYVKSTETRLRSLDTSKERERRLMGFIFVEVDRITNPPSKLEGWRGPIQEFSFVASISLGLIPKYAKYSSLLLGIIPWAPIPSGHIAMQQYERELCDLHLEPSDHGMKRPHKVKGFRYLLQDEPRRTMLGARFLESLRWMGRRGYAFECTIDCRESTLWQLEEVIEMMARVNRQVARDEDLVQVVISHLAKPDFRNTTTSSEQSHQYHKRFVSLIEDLSRFPNVAVKFSGVFSQLPAHLQQLPPYPACSTSPSPGESSQWINDVAQRVSAWTNPIYKCFGGKRVIWGSDWPVCNVMGGQDAWSLYERVTERLLSEAGISNEDREGFWWDNARRIYKVKTDEREPCRI